MAWIDLEKAIDLASKLRQELSDEELTSSIKYLFNTLEESARKRLVNLLKNTGYLEPLIMRDNPMNL